MRDWIPRTLVYGLLACALTWPAALRPASALPGGERTDLWDSLWSLWFVQQALARGELPWRTALLGWPEGGVLMVADPLNALLAAPALALLGVEATWTLLVIGHIAFAGLAAHALARWVFGVERAGWVAGVAWACAPVLLSAVQNGTSEALPGGWLALAVLGVLRALDEGGARRVLWGGLGLAGAAVGSWYMGVCAWLFWGAAALLGRPGLPRRVVLGRALGVAALALALTLPVAWLSHRGASHPDNLVGIKHERELMTVRRTVGAADPRGFWIPGDWRSPDFRVLSRYSEGFIHCTYLGYALLFAAGWALRRRREGLGAFVLAGLAGGLLALGPVVVRDGQAWILDGRLAVPLPYLLLERLPGFSSLSLVYRLAAAPALALAVLAGGAAAALTPRGAALLGAVVLAELRLAAPTAGLPEHTPAPDTAALRWLREAPEGAVMNFPVVGGRAYLYEQTVHQKPMAAGLNFSNNSASRRVWSALLSAAERGLAPDALRAQVARAARGQKVRYLVVHEDPLARPDMHDSAVRALAAAAQPAASGPGVQVYALW